MRYFKFNKNVRVLCLKDNVHENIVLLNWSTKNSVENLNVRTDYLYQLITVVSKIIKLEDKL